MTQTPNSALPAKAEKEPKKGKRTEAVALMIKVWLCALILEAVHLILSVVLTMFNRSELFAQAEETAEQAAQSTGQELSDSFVQLVAYGSVAFSSFISLAIVVLLGIMLWLLNTNSSAAGTGRRLWFAFSLYFGFRVLLVFFTSPGRRPCAGLAVRPRCGRADPRRRDRGDGAHLLLQGGGPGIHRGDGADAPDAQGAGGPAPPREPRQAR